MRACKFGFCVAIPAEGKTACVVHDSAKCTCHLRDVQQGYQKCPNHGNMGPVRPELTRAARALYAEAFPPRITIGE